jgi:hypothetical protein
MQKLFITIFLSLYAFNSYAVWTIKSTLPEVTKFPILTANKTINIAYYGGNSPVPIQEMPQNSSLLLKVVVPPGAVNVMLNAESNDWAHSNGPIMKGYDKYPGEYCPTGNGQNCLDNSRLHRAGGGLNELLFSGQQIIDKPKYVYFVLVVPSSAARSFKFSTIRIYTAIKDFNLYNKWHSQCASKGKNGIEDDCFSTNTTIETRTNTDINGTINTAKLVNMSTRAEIANGDSSVIAGFIIQGVANQKKIVLVKALGKSLQKAGLSTNLNPVLNLYKMETSGAKLIVTNDNWQTDINATKIPTHLRPLDTTESAIIRELEVGTYTAIATPADGQRGLGQVVVDILN